LVSFDVLFCKGDPNGLDLPFPGLFLGISMYLEIGAGVHQNRALMFCFALYPIISPVFCALQKRWQLHILRGPEIGSKQCKRHDILDLICCSLVMKVRQSLEFVVFDLSEDRNTLACGRRFHGREL
jgi:hypothetical protein